MKLLRTINRLKHPRDLWLFLQILLFLVVLPGRIQRNSLPELLGQLDPGVSPVPRNERKMKTTVGFIDSLLKYRVFQRYGKCLLRSLTLFRFLRRQGWPVEIHFGVRKTDEDESPAGSAGSQTAVAPASPQAGNPVSAGQFGITGHSWLVLDDAIFEEPAQQEGRFAETYCYPARI